MKTEKVLDIYGHLMVDYWLLKLQGGCECRKPSGFPGFSGFIKAS